jgi:hypothetical protein
MSLSDDHPVGGEDETWSVPSDPQDEAPLSWPLDQGDPDRSPPR